jgi:hypothetical protein
MMGGDETLRAENETLRAENAALRNEVAVLRELTERADAVPQPTAISGVLQKRSRGGVLKRWQPRFVSYAPGTAELRFFTGADGSGEPAGAVNVLCANAIRDQGGRPAHRIDFIVAGSTEPLSVAAPSAEEAARWLAAVQPTSADGRDALVAGLRREVDDLRHLKSENDALRAAAATTKTSAAHASAGAAAAPGLFARLGGGGAARQRAAHLRAKSEKEARFRESLPPVLQKWLANMPAARLLFARARAALVAVEVRLLQAGDASAMGDAEAILAALRPALDGAFVPLMTPEQLPMLREVAREGDALFAGIYGSVLALVQKDPSFGAFVSAFDALPSGGECRQVDGDALALLVTARRAKVQFDDVLAMLEARCVAAGIDASVRNAPLKHLFRVCEKLALEEKNGVGERRWQAHGICDVVRGSVTCDDMGSLATVLGILLKMHEEGHLVLVRGKNRFSHPTPGGWADGMLNFSVRVLGEGGGAALQFVCELQLIHGKLLTARKEMGGHAVYGGFRCAGELATFFEEAGAGAVVQLVDGLAGGADGTLAVVLGLAVRDALPKAQCAVQDKALREAAAAGDSEAAFAHVAEGALVSWKKGGKFLVLDTKAPSVDLQGGQIVATMAVVLAAFLPSWCVWLAARPHTRSPLLLLYTLLTRPFSVGFYLFSASLTKLKLNDVELPIGELKTATSVDLSSKRLQPTDAIIIASLMSMVNAPLTDLNIGYNEIGVEGAKFIAAVLPQVR